jgi:hypothetical protein
MEPKPFNVTLILPPGHIHSLALKEAADYIHSQISACGYRSVRTSNHVSKENYNVILGAHLMDRQSLAVLPSDTIIFNSEQLEASDFLSFASSTGGGTYQEILRRFFIWDYSARNLPHIPHENKRSIPFHYCRALRRTDISRKRGRSLLFYGTPTPRRVRILESLRETGIPVEVVFGQYDFERDKKMLRSWAVLNLHKEDSASTFEPIRCFYPLINEVSVISEEVDDPSADAFRRCIFFFDSASLIQSARDLYNNSKLFIQKSHAMFSAFQQTSALPDIAVAIESFLSLRARTGS